MNKQQVIAPLVVLIVLGLAVVLVSGRSHRRLYLSSAARMVGEEIVATTNSNGLVTIGEGLWSKLPEFAGQGAGVSRLEFGDESGLGDGRADIRLYLTNSAGRELGIRLKQAGQERMFHVLGYWTPSSPAVK